MSTIAEPPATGRDELGAALLPEGPARKYLGGISLSTLKLLVRRKVLPSVNIGRRKLYRRVDLDAYIQSLTSRPDAA